jgi:6-phosphogluconate dehydrogenase
MGMQLGMIGLGRMGANIVRRIVKDGHTAVGYERKPKNIADLVAELGSENFQGATELKDFVGKLETPRVVWVMIPAGATGAVIDQVAEVLEPGDIIIDGGNSRYHEDIKRAEQLKPKGIHYLDIGTSGGVFGLNRGFCLMIGGEAEQVAYLDPLLKSIAPGVEAAERTPGRTGEPSPAEHGYLHCGPAGAGHFVKMVHNGIEYGAMQAYAEGLNILHKANVGATHDAQFSAEETPLEHPEYYQYDIDIPEVTEVWRRGSVVASWLLDLTATELYADPNLDSFDGRVSDSGEGRWTVDAAIDTGVPAPVLSAALFARFSSRGESLYADKMLSAVRKAFGGHNELPSH